MSKNIKNVMNSKRLTRSSNISHAFVQDTRTGKLYDVKTNSDFFFGHFLKSSIVIKEGYISRSHSTIRYENGKFLLKDNNSRTGTFLNYKKISKEVILQNGDLIAFTENSETWDLVYKFCLLSNPNKKLRLEEENSTVEENDKFKISIEQLENQVKELKIAKTNIVNDFKVQMDELKKSIDNETGLNNKIIKEMLKLQDCNRELNIDLTIYRTRCMLQKELLDTHIAEENSVETLKTEINKLLENEFQCAICNEVFIRPSIANCAHTFCESCLMSWLSQNNRCPTCRSVVHSTTYSLSMENYITNLCDLLGGTIKEQRLALQSERNEHHPPTAIRFRRWMTNQSSSNRRAPYNIIDTVDLTDNTF